MSAFRPRKFRAISAHDFCTCNSHFADSTADQDLPVIYKYVKDSDLIQVRRDTVNIVLSRNIRRNVRVAADIAIGLHELGEKVFYVNSYAGERLLWDSLTGAMRSAGVEGNRSDRSDRTNRTDPSPKTAEPNKTDKPDNPGSAATKILPNLDLIDSPIGCWEEHTFYQEVKWNKPTVIVINSFEYAPVTRAQREKFARALLSIKEEFGLTVILFSHEMKKDVEANMPARGAIGVLTIYSDSVSRIGEPQKQIGCADVHENKMQNSDEAVIENSDVSVHYEDYWENPWKDNSIRTGAYLAMYTRTPRLHAWFLAHPEDEYEHGYEPTEEGLKWTEDGLAKIAELEQA